MRYLSFIVALVILVAFASLASAQSAVSLTLAEQSGSGQSGTATLTEAGAQTEVVIDITPGPAGVAQPVHIHDGSCGASLGGVRYPLTNVVDGKSTTTVAAALSSLVTGNFAINVHKSGAEIAVYVACGAIPATTLPTTGASDLGPIIGLAALAALVLGAGWMLRRRAA